jgi:uncharacterized protein
MEIEFDPEKRRFTLEHRGVDMANASAVFEGTTVTINDDRKDYGEVRYITFGKLLGRMVVLAWTKRSGRCRVISMRKANDREQKTYNDQLD